MVYAVGVDIGGSHIEGVRIDSRKRVTNKTTIKLPKRSTKKAAVGMLYSVLDGLCEDKGLKGIGIGVAGAVKDGVLIRSPNSPFMDSTDFRKLVSGKYETRVVVDNDVTCMAFGEMMKRDEENILVVTLGTGIGGGLVSGGRLYRGKSHAGEIGHMSIRFDGPVCVCGNTGCFEEYASARGVRRLAAEITGRKMESHTVFEQAAKGNKAALRVWKEYGKLLGTGLSNLCFILDPEVIVIGGGISEASEYFMEAVKKEMRNRMFIPLPKIAVARTYANAFGAACMALEGQPR